MPYYATSVLANILGTDQSGCWAPHTAIPCGFASMLWIRDSLTSYAEDSWQEDLLDAHGKSFQ